jgi:AAA domain
MLDFNTATRAPQRASPQQTERRLDALRAALRSRAPDLVREMFPAARINGDEARIGDAQGSPGESMSIALRGDKAGQWIDYNAGAAEPQGDLITLWSLGQNYGSGAGFWRAVEDLELHLGLTTGAKWLGPVAQVAAERSRQPKAAEPTEVSKTTYVYTSTDGQAVLAQVVRKDMDDGSKRFFQRDATGAWKSPEVRPLYNLPGIVSEPCVVLVEGEKCADALGGLGISATTLMGGAKTSLDKADLEPLRGKQVVTWADNDAAGTALMAAVTPRLRAMGCEVVSLTVPADAPPKWDAADAVAEGRDVAVLIAAAQARPVQLAEAAPLQIDRSLRLLTLRQLSDARPPRWLIDGVLPEACFACVVGPPASLKSFLVLDFGLRIANGLDWVGRDVMQGSVVYVAGEGQAALTNRTAGWTAAKGGSPDAPFLTVPESVAMPTGQLDELLALIRTMDAPPVLVILDTLARNFGVGDENSSTDMGAFVRACDRLRTETGACVLVVHHTGKDVEKGARGSSALTGAADCIIAVKRKGDGLTVLNRPPFGKMKDAEEFDDIALTASRVCATVRGEQVSTLVLIADDGLVAEPGDPDGEAPVAQRIGPTERLILSHLGRHPGREQGLTAICAAVSASKSSITRALHALAGKGQVVETGEPGALRWSIGWWRVNAPSATVRGPFWSR